MYMPNFRTSQFLMPRWSKKKTTYLFLLEQPWEVLTQAGYGGVFVYHGVPPPSERGRHQFRSWAIGLHGVDERSVPQFVSIVFGNVARQAADTAPLGGLWQRNSNTFSPTFSHCFRQQSTKANNCERKYRWMIVKMANIVDSVSFKPPDNRGFKKHNSGNIPVTWNPCSKCARNGQIQTANLMTSCSVAKFRKLGVKTGLTGTIYTSSKGWNYIHATSCFFPITS